MDFALTYRNSADNHSEHAYPIKVMVLPQTIFDHFSFIAPHYDRLIPLGSRKKMLELLALSPQHRVLDAGGGTGRVARMLQEFVRHVVVADISLGMLREVPREDKLLPVNSQVEYLPFADESFDRVVMVDALHHVTNQEKTAQDMWRVLKPGGARYPYIRSQVTRIGGKTPADAQSFSSTGAHSWIIQISFCKNQYAR
jgi:ubiquinone/menaquinone biosynthesis C-methylase UbiE